MDYLSLISDNLLLLASKYIDYPSYLYVLTNYVNNTQIKKIMIYQFVQVRYFVYSTGILSVIRIHQYSHYKDNIRHIITDRYCQDSDCIIKISTIYNHFHIEIKHKNIDIDQYILKNISLKYSWEIFTKFIISCKDHEKYLGESHKFHKSMCNIIYLPEPT